MLQCLAFLTILAVVVLLVGWGGRLSGGRPRPLLGVVLLASAALLLRIPPLSMLLGEICRVLLHDLLGTRALAALLLLVAWLVLYRAVARAFAVS